jgi:hypothetical protein
MSAQSKISGRLVCVTIALLTLGVPEVTPLSAQVSGTEGQSRPSAEIYLGNSYRYYQLGS